MFWTGFFSSQDPLDAVELKFPKSDLKEISSEADETHRKKNKHDDGPNCLLKNVYLVGWNIFDVHPYLGKLSNLTM